MVWTDRNSGLQTLRNILQVDRGMSFEVSSKNLLPACMPSARISTHT